MTDSFLVLRETHREQDFEEHSIKRPFPFAFEPHTHFTGLQIIFIVDILENNDGPVKLFSVLDVCWFFILFPPLFSLNYPATPKRRQTCRSQSLFQPRR